VIASSAAAFEDKSEILSVDYALPSNEDAIAAFKEGMVATSDGGIRQRLLGELIRMGDVSELPEVAHLLLTHEATESQRTWLLFVIGNRLSSPQAIPALQPLLRSEDGAVRVAAVEALWHIADQDALPELARALQDPDEQVRFYAVRGLSDIANEPGWGGPSESEFQQHQEIYIAHWQEWAKSRDMPR
jgi:HEAT repeat protein